MKKLCLFIVLLSVFFHSSFAKFGLFGDKGESLQLLKLKTKAVVEGPYAEIQYIQTYKNPLDHPIETQFYFPRTDTSVFHKFEAEFRGKTIVGRVLEKERAQKMYEWNVEKGNTVAYSDRNVNAPDVMNIKVGNIPPGESVEIRFSVIEPLELVINKFFGLKLPAVLTERYAPSSVDLNQVPVIQNVDLKGSLYKEWQIEVELKSEGPLSFVSNPSHNFKPKIFEDSRIHRTVWNVTIVPNKDFIVYFSPEKIEDLGAIYATHPDDQNDHVLLVNFIPPLNNVDKKKAQKFLETSEDGLMRIKEMALQDDIENAKGEFLFVIDRSGSMSGARIENLKRALIKFLLILPKNAYFNIISFGSSYQLYKTQSIKNSPQALEEATKWAHTIDADMGGTEILEPLRHLTKSSYHSNEYLRTVIVLTDGDVFNPDEVIRHVTEHSDKMRFCSVGIGYGASEYLVKNVGRAGKCRSEFVLDGEDIGEKAIYLVKAAISQYLKDINFNLECVDGKNNQVHSEEAKVDMLMKDQPFKKWIYLKDISDVKSCQITVSYHSSLDDKVTTKKFRISGLDNAEVTDIWHKLAYDVRIKELEQKVKSTYSPGSLKEEITGLSTRYQILSDYTSFLAVAEENTVDPKKEGGRPAQIKIPNLDSADYAQSDCLFAQKAAQIELDNEGYHEQARAGRASRVAESFDELADGIGNVASSAVNQAKEIASSVGSYFSSSVKYSKSTPSSYSYAPSSYSNSYSWWSRSGGSSASLVFVSLMGIICLLFAILF